MRIPLKKFENVIDDVILKRGFSYYMNELVTDFLEIDNNEYEATVLGESDIYFVDLKVKNDEVIEYSCDCPYDKGPVCKHVVATIYYLTNLNQEEVKNSSQNTSSNKKKRKKTITQELNDILDKASHSDLKKFIKEQSRKDNQFRNLFLSHFAHLSEEQTKEFYQTEIRAIVDSAIDDYGISWYDIKELEQDVNSIITIADKQIESGNYLNAIYIYTVLMEELMQIIQIGDDDIGTIYNIIDNSYLMLYEIAKKDLSLDMKRELFEFCITNFNNQLFSGWEWHVDILNIAIEVAENEKDADVIIKCLNTITDDYKKEEADYLKYKILAKFKEPEEFQEFVNENIGNGSIRDSEIENAVNSRDFDKAIKLCYDGIEYNKDKFPGLINQWYEWLLKIAQLQNNRTKIIEYSRILFICSYDPKQDYYQLLKQEVEPNKWNDFLEEMIEDIIEKADWGYSMLLSKIYINEEWWDRLLLLLKEDNSLESIEYYEEYLLKDYSKELVELYRKNIIEYLEEFMGRKHYKKACRYIRRMKKLGGKEEANNLIKYLKKTYPKRTALLDELSMV